MHRFLMTSLVMFLSASSSFADDYLIRVDAVGYEDAVVSEKVPDESVLRSIEMFAQPNKPFRSKVRLGVDSLTLEGMLKPQADGSFSMQVKYSHEVDTGYTVPTADGKEERIMDSTSLECTVTIKLDETRPLGGMESGGTEIVPGKESDVQSKLYHFLIVTRQKPLQD